MAIYSFQESIIDAFHEINIILEAQIILFLELIFIFKKDRHFVLLNRLHRSLHCLQIASLYINFHKTDLLGDIQTIDSKALYFSAIF